MHSLGLEGGRAVGCPRCGYDQRGTVALWREQCPLEGRCAECGLTFSWAELIVPDKFEPAWCVEFARPWRRVPMACVKTFVRSFRPWKFWSRMSMAQRVRPWRLAVYVAFGVLPVLLCYVATQAAVAINARLELQRELAQYQQRVPIAIANIRSALQRIEAGHAQRGSIENDLTDEERARHIGALTVQLAQFQVLASNPPLIKHSWLSAVHEAVVFPWRRSSRGTVQLGDGTIFPYPAPVTLHAGLDWSRTFGRRRSWAFNLLDHWILATCSGLILLALLPGSFILLPASRRRAKVRWAHVGRIAVYGMFIPYGLILCGWATILGLAVATSPNAEALLELAGRYGPLLLWLALPLWWWAAISRYLKMPHAGAIAWVMTLMIALLLSPLLFTVLPEGLVDFILGT